MKNIEDLNTDIENLKEVVELLRERADMGDALTISQKRNETDLDSIEVGNSKTGKFKLYFNLGERNAGELSNMVDKISDAARYANKEIGVAGE